MADYHFTHTAIEDLSEIWNNTYKAWSKVQADKYFELLISACKDISENAAIGKSYHEIDSSTLGFRVGRHILFYRVNKRSETEILRILHQRMDLKNWVED